MDWQDDGYVLSVGRFGDHDAILDVLTKGHGRHLGLVKGGMSKTRRADLQPGNQVRVDWKARLSEQLGRYEIEPVRAYASLALDSGLALAGLTAAASVASACLPERELHPAVCEGFGVLMEALTGAQPSIAPVIFVKWEAGLLQDLGFGLDLTKCAVTGSFDNLAFVSPRTGRAVCHEAAAPYASRLMALPPFLLGNQAGSPTPADLAAGLRLTGHFLAQSVLEPHGKTLPQARDYYADLVTR
ncbi:DNA repair protein RecO [Alphaproteobacteria bacterium SO-S41]|nr:DNA repair protein RecO [Alphaproteobacteria bacterium SO-S41]